MNLDEFSFITQLLKIQKPPPAVVIICIILQLLLRPENSSSKTTAQADAEREVRKTFAFFSCWGSSHVESETAHLLVSPPSLPRPLTPFHVLCTFRRCESFRESSRFLVHFNELFVQNEMLQLKWQWEVFVISQADPAKRYTRRSRRLKS